MSALLALFPGQGSQAVGMGRHLWEGHAAAAAVFAEAEDMLGFDLRGLCLEGPLEELTRTDRAQPAIFVCSVATWRVMEAAGEIEPPGRPDAAGGSSAGAAATWAVALGHSLGEYGALVAAGHLEFGDALGVVERRGAAMRECGLRHPGAMAAVLGLDDRQVEDVCARRDDVWPANYNAPSQVVISGSVEGVAEAGRLALEAGAKRVVPLQVSGAFHSPFMAEAAVELARALEGVTVRQSDGVRFFSTTEVRMPASGELKDVLVRQVTAPVRFAQSLAMLTPGASLAVEVGPGNVLSGLARKASKGLESVGTGDGPALAAAVDRVRRLREGSGGRGPGAVAQDGSEGAG